ncbi:group III truncated hemoglobin [Henriciella sp.]|jgi:hemoglobin|uniref:group III truncated hemoglobin n=1 Tax=Henriciella sp. TaxID=1968823 RepID=UPI000C11EA7B|nr:group III truncated hemoglobin [Henriciella sp.]PHR79534.1 MAG: globin [Henriciella sp.]|tara:strand:- start:1263 stop:1703 length:441 start_codon:yes stop_codon:yes gene_type:complete
MTYQIRSAEERRRDIQDNAARLGIDDDFISMLVETFYARVRAHPRLGPIFNGEINDWPDHLAKLKDFWASVAMNAGRYSGKPVPAHMKLEGIRREDFALWLGLFQQTLEEISPGPETVEFFMQRAARIAQSLQLAMSGLESLGRRA